MAPPGNGVGCDAYGEIVAVGSNLKTPLKVGQHIAFFTLGSFHSPEKGTFSEYATAFSDTSIVVPDGYDPYQASSFGIGGFTAIQTVFDKLGVKNVSKDLSELPRLGSDAPQLLVWAGSTSVGQFAIQLGRLAGYHVITTASPKNHDYLKELGAADCFDYRDERTPSKIHEKYPNLQLALDCFSEKGSTIATAKSLSDKGGKVSNILPTEKGAQEARPDVEFIVSVVYSIHGIDFNFGRPGMFGNMDPKKDNQFIQPWSAGEDSILHNLMAKGLIKGNKIKKLGKGLEKIEEGMDLLQRGEGTIEKLAYDVA